MSAGAMSPPAYDVGAHVRSVGEELCYVLEGELEPLALEPMVRSGDRHDWEDEHGRRFLRGGLGSLLFVPAGVPHAFANPTAAPARMLSSRPPSGHENYFDELVELLRDGKPDPAAVADLRRRHDIEQLTPIRTG